MERLGDILKRNRELKNTSGENTDTWSTADLEDENPAPGPLCEICHGTKYVHPLLPGGKPNYRVVVPCECALKEIEKEKADRLQKYSNLGSLTKCTFDKLLPEGRKAGGKNLFEYKPAFDGAFTFAGAPAGWLIIVGPSGSGKTHLACAIANYRISQGETAFYIEAADLLDYLRSTYHPDSTTSYDELFEQVKNAPLLILDNLNISAVTPWAKEKLRQILNFRYNGQIPTVITSSLPPEDLENSLECHLTDPELSRVFYIKKLADKELEHFGGQELDLIRRMSFENFDYKRMNLSSEERQNLEQAYNVALNFAASPQGWVVFLGQNGSGKTHLAAAIANSLHAAGKTALFVVVPDLLDHLRSAFSPESQVSYDYLFERIKKAPVLILDDYGEQAATPWAQEKLYQLVNYRYNAQLPTVFTMSYSLDEIENRISSRMVDHSLSLVFTITAPDYRGDRKAATKSPRARYKKA
jgi:DNA replication protein DnaC